MLVVLVPKWHALAWKASQFHYSPKWHVLAQEASQAHSAQNVLFYSP